MKKNVLVFGTISGLIFAGFMVYASLKINSNPYFESNDVVGYAGMIAVFALMYVGIKNHRDKYLGGFISFGKAFKTGFLIALLASSIYVGVWLVEYYLFIPDWLDKYIEHALYCIKAKGATAAEVQAKAVELADFKKMYKNPLFVVFVSYMEILPVGILVALISALILKRKPKPGS